MGIFDSPYELNTSTVEAFAEHLIDKNIRVEHGKLTLIAKYPKNPADGDGQSVEVYCYAAPAEFFTIKALGDKNSYSENKTVFTLETGSGMAYLSAQIAQAISEGMLVIGSTKKQRKHKT